MGLESLLEKEETKAQTLHLSFSFTLSLSPSPFPLILSLPHPFSLSHMSTQEKAGICKPVRELSPGSCPCWGAIWNIRVTALIMTEEKDRSR